MKNKSFYLLLSGMLVLASNSSLVAQPNPPQPPRGPNLLDQREQLRKEIDEILNGAFFQPAPRPFGRSGSTWGGVRFTRVDPALQEQLGLPENEGLVVAAVDPDSSAEKAGLKANDVLVKINNKTVPGDPEGLALIVKEQKPDAGIDLVIVREGKEETLQGARMPAFVDAGGFGGGFGGKRNPRPGMDGFGFPRFKGNFGKNPFGPKGNRVMQAAVNGASITRRDNGDTFSGEYRKDELKITVSGKRENGLAKPTEIVIQEGMETKRYTDVKDVPAPHRPIVSQLIGPLAFDLMDLPEFRNLRDFPGLPVIPGIDR